MGFRQALAENLGKIESVYDLAAFCYDYLIKNVENQARFIGEYAEENESAEHVNPNLKALKILDDTVKKVLMMREEHGISFYECLENVQAILERTTLEEYGEPLLNDAAIPFFILLAIDRYVTERRWVCVDKAPLNKGYCEDSYIYMNVRDNMLDDAAEQNDFPKVILPYRIQSQMEHLIILEVKEIPNKINPPQVVHLWIDQEKKGMIFNEKKLKIAVIPFSRDKMLKFPVKHGGLFRVEYEDEHIKKGAERAIKLLESAIEEKANIIIFPEYICSQGIQDAIQNRLKDIYENKSQREKASALLLVVAGSCWTEDNNNVSRIFSYSGMQIGKQYKQCVYSDLKDKGKVMVEDLADPGKETTIVDIAGVGKILIGICRDISERSYTRTLARTFMPQFLLVPAWSRSVHNGFKEQFREITAENHRTCSVLCNCCGALNNGEKFNIEIGLAVTPYKKNTVVVGNVDMICREEGCIKKCKENGCVFIVDMDFGHDMVMVGRMLNIHQHI